MGLGTTKAPLAVLRTVSSIGAVTGIFQFGNDMLHLFFGDFCFHLIRNDLGVISGLQFFQLRLQHLDLGRQERVRALRRGDPPDLILVPG